MSTRYDDPSADPPSGAARAAQRAERGEHLCSFHDDARERGRLTTAFAAGALAAGDRLLYVSDGEEASAIGRMLAHNGIEPDGPLHTGQLRILDFAALFGTRELLDLDTVLAAYRREADFSRTAGYPGLSVAVQMQDMPRTLGSLDAAARWERVIGSTFGAVGITAVCQYDRRFLDDAACERLTGEHAAVAVDDGTIPLATFRAARAGQGLQVVGELDLTTAPAFARALRARSAVSPLVQVDLEHVTFADVTGLRTVFEVARELPWDSTLVLTGVPPALLRLLALVGWRDPRVKVQRG